MTGVLSERAAGLSAGLKTQPIATDNPCLGCVTLPGTLIRLFAPPVLSHALSARFVFASTAEPHTAQIEIAVVGSVYHLWGPQGGFQADSCDGDKVFFAAGTGDGDAFAGSYSGWRSAPEGAAMALLDAEIVRQIFEVSTAAALLHATWLRRLDAPRAAILLGSSGAGKSTIARNARISGWQVVADDMVCLMPCGALYPFPRRSLLDGAPVAIDASPDVPDRADLIAFACSTAVRDIEPKPLDAVLALKALEAAILISKPTAPMALMALMRRISFLTLERAPGGANQTWARAERALARCT